MISYRDFANDLLVALYRLHLKTKVEFIRLEDGLVHAGLDNNEVWLKRFADEVEENGWLSVNKVIGDRMSWNIRFRPAGYEQVEEVIGLDDEDEDDAVSLKIVDEVNVEIIPASDRMVALNHNSQSYKDVSVGLSSLAEELRSSNDLNCTAIERERLVVGLTAAKVLWESAELEVVQIQIGVILAIEDAASVLVPLGKAVGTNLIVDLIKQIIKSTTGIQF